MINVPSISDEEDAKFERVPRDFPRPFDGSLSGAQLKLFTESYRGRLYPPGCTPPEVYRRWDTCEDLACHLAKKSLESKAGRRPNISKTEVLAHYLPRLIAAKCTSEREARWVIRRAAAMLDSPVPISAIESNVGESSVG